MDTNRLSHMDAPEIIRYYERLMTEKQEQLLESKRQSSAKDAQISHLQAIQNELNSTIKGEKKESQSLREVIVERNKIIDDQGNKIRLYERQISDLKSNNKNLSEAFNETMQELVVLKRKDKEMLKEFVKYKLDREYDIIEVSHKLKCSYKENHQQMMKMNNLKTLIERFQSELQNCINLIQDPKKLKITVKDLYETFGRPGNMLNAKLFDDNAGFVQHSELLQRTILALKREMTGQRAAHQAETHRILKENMLLMKDLNKFRQEVKTLCAEVADSKRKTGGKKQRMESRAQSSFSAKPPQQQEEENVYMPPLTQTMRLSARPGQSSSFHLPPITSPRFT